MTTCDPVWIGAAVVTMTLVVPLSLPILLLALVARTREPRLALVVASLLALAGIFGTAILTRGLRGFVAVAPVLFVPALLGCAYAALRPDRDRVRVAIVGAILTLGSTMGIAGIVLADGLTGPPCP